MIDPSMIDPSLFDPALLGRLSFRLSAPTQAPMPAGRHWLGIAEERDTMLYVPNGVDTTEKLPLLVMFHGAGGFPEKVLPFLEQHAEQRGFLLMLPHSMLPTWDIVIGGNGPDLERLNKALTKVAAHFHIDPEHFGFAGFSDGASYSLSNGLTNGDLVSHVIVFSGGFMSVFMQQGTPKVFIAHGLIDEQLPIETSGRAHAAKLKASGYEVEYVEFNGLHVIHPPVVELSMNFFLGEKR